MSDHWPDPYPETGRCERCGDPDASRCRVNGERVTVCETCRRFVESAAARRRL